MLLFRCFVVTSLVSLVSSSLLSVSLNKVPFLLLMFVDDVVVDLLSISFVRFSIFFTGFVAVRSFLPIDNSRFLFDSYISFYGDTIVFYLVVVIVFRLEYCFGIWLLSDNLSGHSFVTSA